MGTTVCSKGIHFILSEWIENILEIGKRSDMIRKGNMRRCMYENFQEQEMEAEYYQMFRERERMMNLRNLH